MQVPIAETQAAAAAESSAALEAALADSRERYRLAAATGDLWDTEFPSGRSMISPQIKRRLGYAPHEIDDCAAAWQALIHPEDAERVREALREHLRGRATYDIQYRVRARCGDWRWVHARGQASRDAAGRAAFMAGTLIDISERKAAEERADRLTDLYAALSRTNGAIVRLREPESLLSEICAICVDHGHARMAYVVMRRGDALVRVASAGPADEYLGTAAFSLDPSRPEGRGPLALAMREGRHCVVNDFAADPRTVPWREPAARIGTRSVAVFPIRRGGEVVGAFSLHATTQGFFDARLLGLLDDLSANISFALDNADRETARIAAEAQARAGFDQFSKVFHGAPLAATITNLAEGRMLDVNDAFCTLVEQPREALVGRTPVEVGLIAPEERDRMIAALLAGQGRLRDFELRGRRASGEWGTLLVNAELIALRGERCMMALYNDMTDVRRAEAAEQAQRAAEAASRAKTEFLSRMSHELRTPLNAVLGFAQLLQMGEGAPLSPRARGQVEHIAQAGWHLLALINDVLDVSRIEAGALQIETQSVELHALLDEAIELSAAQAAAREVRCEVLAPQAAAPLVARGDAVRLRQVLLNVVSNAIKYNRPGGRVWLAASACEGGRACIEVRDDGLGMSAEQLAHLFEPFNRLGRETSGIEGTGIGLVLSRQLMRLMHGALDVESAPQRGTCVRLSLPRQAGGADVLPRAASTRPAPLSDALGADDGPRGTLLYIEDDPVNALIVEQMLGAWKHLRLVRAEDGARGLAAARACRPDLVLLDMRLPDMDGLEVLRALRADAATRKIRVVALSASAMPDEVAAARRCGAHDYWTKPIAFAPFLAGLRELLGG